MERDRGVRDPDGIDRGRLAPDEAVEVRGEGIDVDRVRDDVGVTEARDRFGGVDVPAILAGMLAALGTAVLLATILGGVGVASYQAGFDGAQPLTIAGAVAGLVTVLISFLVGGWVAGRIARYDGGRNGLLTAVAFLLLAAVVSVLGAVLGNDADLFSRVNMPRWFSPDATTPVALIAGLVALLVMLGAGWLGGRKGEQYHRRADALLVHTREGGVVRQAGLQRGGTVASGRRDGDTRRSS